jgi:hypothetical protein
MTSQEKIAFISLKQFLILLAVIFAVAATWLTLFWGTAATDTGSNPTSAISLVQGTNSGVLGPGQQRWFRFIPSPQQPGARLEQTLTLIFTPASAHLLPYISLQIFTEDQVQLFPSNQMAHFGAGQLISRDADPQTGELFWQGQLVAGRVYYIQLRNETDFSIDYWLLTEEVRQEVASAEGINQLAQPATSEDIDPMKPISLSSGLYQGKLKPQATAWYTFNRIDFTDSDPFHSLKFSFFFTPDDGNRRHKVNFKLFSAAEMAKQQANQTYFANFGAGMLVSRDGDPNTGERVWAGTIIEGETYFLAIENSSEVEIDYWLFDRDIYHPELGPKPKPTSPPDFAIGAAPQTAIPLNVGENIGRLAPGQETWRSFSAADADVDYFEETALTLIFTPDDGQRIQRVTFDIFTPEGVRDWSPGSDAGISNTGAGSVVYRDNNPLTGERFWTGWLVDNALYYVRLRNGADAPVDYWLFTGDVVQPELGKALAGGN